jgi:hypothetical protein
MWEDHSEMLPVTHTDLFVLITVAACIHVGVLAFAIWAALDGRRMVAEAQRLTKAVGAPVIQEEEKTRQLFPR